MLASFSVIGVSHLESEHLVCTMSSAEQQRVLDHILHPDPENAEEILHKLGLAGIPEPEQVHREIEEKLLLPKDKLPEHWLPTYQM